MNNRRLRRMDSPNLCNITKYGFDYTVINGIVVPIHELRNQPEQYHDDFQEQEREMESPEE